MSQPDELDDVTAERLLRGEVDPSDAPVGYEHLAALIRQAKQPATQEERHTLPALPYAHPVLPAAAGTTAGGVWAARRRRWAVPAAVAAAAVVLGTTGVAAASGNLPGPAQGLVSRAAQAVGVRIPDGDTTDDSAEPADVPDASTTTAVGPPSSVPVGPPSSVPVASPPVTTPEGAPTDVVCAAFASGQGDANGLLRELYRRATGNPAAEVADPGAAREAVVVLCATVSVSVPPSDAGTPPGQEQTPPGQTNTPPGQEQTPPGQTNTPPGQGGTSPSSGPPASTPGQGSNPPSSGPPASSPGQGSGAGSGGNAGGNAGSGGNAGGNGGAVTSGAGQGNGQGGSRDG